MENSHANRLPEADSLPDGFVESSTETSVVSPRAAVDYMDAFLELDRSVESGEKFPVSETLSPDGGAEGLEKLSISHDPLPEMESPDSCGDSKGVEDKIVLPEPGNDPPEASKEIVSPQDELRVGSSREDNGGDCRSSDRASLVNAERGITGPFWRRKHTIKDTEGCLELHTTNLKERPTSEYTESLKNRKLESSEAKRKIVKRSIKSDKELLEFTLKYQKVIAERDAAVAVRERLESLCRELQRQNRMLMDECQRVSTEGQNMRSDLSTKFNDAIKDVSNKLEEQKDDCLSQLKENEMLRNKLKHLADQYSLSEQLFAQKLKLAELKIQQHQERSAQEQTQMQLYVEQVAQLLATEKNLRTQLVADGEKFQQFQDALLKSNEVFETFKQEMEKMAKLIKDLKKENVFLKSKCEKSDFALVKLVEERELMKKQLEKVKNQKEKLESLCRSLQAERKQSLVGGDNTDPVTAPVKIGSSEEDS